MQGAYLYVKIDGTAPASPEDCTRGLLTFDRDVAGAPGEVDLWVGDHKGFTPELVQPRVCRVRFNCPVYGGLPWNFNPAAGTFWGADGCTGALAASGMFQGAGGSAPTGKFWVNGVSYLDANRLAFSFSMPVSVGGGNPGGFWCLDEWGNTQYGASADQMDSNITRVVFPANVPEHGSAGLLAGFDDVAEAANLLCPVGWRY